MAKFLQARHVLEQSGLTVVQHKGHKRPYDETYADGEEALLRDAVDQVRTRPGSSSIFIVEDTSLRIEALSDQRSDVPGLSVKEWFQTTTFDELDRRLRSLGNDRRARVTSRVALSLPNLDRPIRFSASSNGVVAETPPSFEANPLYPWLNAVDFSAWFVPDGSTRRLGEMSVDESYRFDHRTQSLLKLVDRLEEYAAALNLGTQAVRVRQSWARRQATLFPSPEILPDVVICGLMCSGKSSAAQWLSVERDFRRVEASAYLEAAAEQAGLPGLPTRAELALALFEQEGPDAVERYIGRHTMDLVDVPVVYSGARTMEGLARVVEVLNRPIVADDRLRFERCVRRARSGDPRDWTSFQRRDDVDREFGLLGFVRDVSDIVLTNESNPSRLIARLDEVVGGWRNWARVRIPARYKAYAYLEAKGGHALAEEVGSVLPEGFRGASSLDRLTEALRPGVVIEGSDRLILTAWARTYMQLVRRRLEKVDPSSVRRRRR